MQEDLREALIKKAVGYTVSEITKEFTVDDDGNKRVIKEKEATKYIPPDVSALKALIELDGAKDEFGDMTDAELEKERERLIKELFDKDGNNDKTVEAFNKEKYDEIGDNQASDGLLSS